MSVPSDGKSPLVLFAIEYCKENSIPFVWNGSFLTAYKDASHEVMLTNFGTISYLGNYSHDASLEQVKRLLDCLR